VPIEQFLLLLGMAIAVIVTLIGVIVAAWFQWKHGAEDIAAVPVPLDSEPGTGLSILGPRTAADVAALNIPRPGTADRVIRVMAFVFLAAVAAFVAVTNAFPATAVEIELLLAAGILFVVFMQDLLPASVLGRARYWIEAGAALAFMAVLVGLSGGLSSPFLPGFFLIVAGASLAIDGMAPILLAVLAGLSYGLVGVLVAGPTAIMPTQLAWLGFNVVALALLAYLATVAGREQRHARDAAIRLSRFDPLTGLYNRNFFFSVMDREIRRAVRMGRGFSLLMLDLDDLKPVNDTFGHQYGDRLLRAVTDVVQRGIRGTDIAARYGGDEFVVMLPDTDPSGAFVVAEKLRSDIANLALRADERTVRTSVSIGLVAYGEDGTTIETLMSSVDAAMYESKRRGKNQIVGYATRSERVATGIGPSVTERVLGQAPGGTARPPRGTGRRTTVAAAPAAAAVPEAGGREAAARPEGTQPEGRFQADAAARSGADVSGPAGPERRFAGDAAATGGADASSGEGSEGRKPGGGGDRGQRAFADALTPSAAGGPSTPSAARPDTSTPSATAPAAGQPRQVRVPPASPTQPQAPDRLGPPLPPVRIAPPGSAPWERQAAPEALPQASRPYVTLEIGTPRRRQVDEDPGPQPEGQ